MGTLAFQDTFVGSSAGAIAGRVSTSGHHWANSTATNQNQPVDLDSTPAAVPSVDPTACLAVVSDWTPPSSSYGFGCLHRCTGADQFQSGPFIRWAVAGDGSTLGYGLMADTYFGGFTLYKGASATSFDAVASATHTFANGDENYLYIYASNDGTGGVNVTCYVDGVSVITYHDTGQSGHAPATATGQVAIRLTDQTSTGSTRILSCQTDAQAATLSGPTSGTAGVASSNFLLTLEVPSILGTTITPSDASGGGTFTPPSPSIARASGGTPGATSATFTYTAASAGTRSISASTTNPTATVAGSPISYAASAAGPTTATLTGPTSGGVGIASTAFTVTLDRPAGAGGVVVTLSSTGSGDTFA